MNFNIYMVKSYTFVDVQVTDEARLGIPGICCICGDGQLHWTFVYLIMVK